MKCAARRTHSPTPTNNRRTPDSGVAPRSRHEHHLLPCGSGQLREHQAYRDPADTLRRLAGKADTATAALAAAEQAITALTGDSAIAALPDPDRWLTTAHQRWDTHRAARKAAEEQATNRVPTYPAGPTPSTHRHTHDYPPPHHEPSIGF